MLLAKEKGTSYSVGSFHQSLKHGILNGLQNLSETELNEIGFYYVDATVPVGHADLGWKYNEESNKVVKVTEFIVIDEQAVFEAEKERLLKLNNSNLGASLGATDCYHARRCDTGQELPASVVTARQSLRDNHAAEEIRLGAATTSEELIKPILEDE